MLKDVEIEQFLTTKGLSLDLSAHALSKLLARYELFKRIMSVPGDIIECGVYRGASLFLWANLLEVFAPRSQRRVLAFDTFRGFPKRLVLAEDRANAERLGTDANRFHPRTLQEIKDTAISLGLDKRI